MKKESLVKKIIALGGTASIGTEDNIEAVRGRLGKFSIYMRYDGIINARPDDAEYDVGSDYNPSDVRILYRLADLHNLIK